MDVRNTLALQAYAQSRLEMQPQPPAEDASTAFAAAMTDLSRTVAMGEEQARAAMTTGADPHAVVMALAQTELAVQTAVTIRDRVVEAYQEILRMPV